MDVRSIENVCSSMFNVNIHVRITTIVTFVRKIYVICHFSKHYSIRYAKLVVLCFRFHRIHHYIAEEIRDIMPPKCSLLLERPAPGIVDLDLCVEDDDEGDVGDDDDDEVGPPPPRHAEVCPTPTQVVSMLGVVVTVGPVTHREIVDDDRGYHGLCHVDRAAHPHSNLKQEVALDLKYFVLR